jgi:U6 snRNA-associated Sm-like protein LSm6
MSTNGESPTPDATGDSRDPSGFLSEIIGAPVTVKLNSGIVYKGSWIGLWWWAASDLPR